MVDNNYSATIYQGADGVKYAFNPFANGQDQVILPSKSRLGECVQLCQNCNMSFDNNSEYEHHITEMHGGKKLLICPHCDASFRRQDHLKRHIHSLHLNEKFYHCPVCGKDCKRQDILDKHVKRKHSNKPAIFHCRKCEYHCGTLEVLKSHEEIHLMPNRHPCSYCNTSFKRRDHMLRHIKSQHLNHSVVCPICNQVYKRKDHVVRHVREKHRMGLLNGKLVKSTDLLEVHNQ